MAGAVKREFIVDTFAKLATVSIPQDGDRAYVSDEEAWFSYSLATANWKREYVKGASVDIPLGVRTVTVVFAAPRYSISYSVPCQMTNIVDSEPWLQPVHVVGKTVNGFTALWNDETETVNYKLDYVVVDY